MTTRSKSKPRHARVMLGTHPEETGTLSGRTWCMITHGMHENFGLPELVLQHIPTMWITSACSMVNWIIDHPDDYDLEDGNIIQMDKFTQFRLQPPRIHLEGPDEVKALELVPLEPEVSCHECGKRLNDKHHCAEG